MSLRPGSARVLERLGEGSSRLVFVAPTGYGKTSLTFTLAERMLGERYPRLIHALPLRAVLEQLYERLVEKLGERFSVGYQAMGLGVSGKTPFMAPDVVVTTYDSLLVNVLRGNVAERGLGHYEAPRAHILSSLIILDEVHLGLRQEGLTDTLYTTLWALRLMGVESILETATLPPTMLKSLIDYTRPDAIVAVAPSSSEACTAEMGLKSIGNVEVVEDREFFEAAAATRWRFTLLEKGELVSFVEKLVENGLRVLVVLSTVREAIEVYERLGERVDSVSLIHGRLAPIDRRRYVRMLEEGSAKVLVGTSAVEAGVDVDFDVLVTSVAEPSSLLQRMGRVARRPGRLEEAHVYILREEGAERLLHELVGVNPRLPCTWRGVKGYARLLGLEEAPRPRLSYRRFTLTTHPVLDPAQLEEVLSAFCDLVRDDPLVPLIPSVYIEDALSTGFLGDYTFPVRLSTLTRRAGEVLEWCDSRRVKVVRLEVRGEGVVEGYRVACSEALGKALARHSNCATVMRVLEREAIAAIAVRGYRRGLGLV